MSMNIRYTFYYLQTNILSPSRITIVLSFYFRNIYHKKQPRLLSFHWPEPNNQYIFSFLFSFFFSFLFSFLSLFCFLKYLSHEATQAAFFSLAKAEQPIYFVFSFLFYSTNHHNFSATKFDMPLKSTSHRV